MKLKSIGLKIFLLVLFFLVLFFYYAKLIFSEGRIISKDSIVEQYLLIPDILKDKKLTDLGNLNYYYYSAQDGVKPMVYAVIIQSDKDRENIKHEIDHYFLANNFNRDDDGDLIYNNQRIDIQFKKSAENYWVVNIALLERN